MSAEVKVLSTTGIRRLNCNNKFRWLMHSWQLFSGIWR